MPTPMQHWGLAYTLVQGRVPTRSESQDSDNGCELEQATSDPCPLRANPLRDLAGGPVFDSPVFYSEGAARKGGRCTICRMRWLWGTDRDD
jgi:hypothetical protein